MLGVTHHQRRSGIQPFTTGAISPKSAHLSMHHNQETACVLLIAATFKASEQRLWRWSPHHAPHGHDFLLLS